MKNSFVAGACKVDITPVSLDRVFLAGFGTNRKADRVLDPLCARVLYLCDGDREFALVNLDLVGLMATDASRLRESVGDIAPDDIWVACTHTHSAPDTIGIWGPSLLGALPVVSGIDKEYISLVLHETASAVRRAKRIARPAQIAFGADATPKSDITWNIRNRDVRDDAVACMVVRSLNGHVIAVLSNYGSHPETLWENNTAVSADWVHYFHETIEKNLGGVSLFFNGALGAMVTPGIEMETDLRTRMKFYKKYGRDIGAFALKAVAAAKPAPDTRIRVETREFYMPFRNEQMKFIMNVGVFKREADYRGVRTFAGIADIGPARFIAAPGEVEPSLALKLKKMAGGAPTFLISLCNDELGYLLPPGCFDDPEYHYEQSMSPGRDVEAALTDLYIGLI